MHANSRPLHRVFCILITGTVALLSSYRSASAQIYVSQGDGTVGEYDAGTASFPRKFLRNHRVPFNNGGVT